MEVDEHHLALGALAILLEDRGAIIPEQAAVFPPGALVNVPDYISPIIGYRIWCWSPGLKRLLSLGGSEKWTPGQAMEALCRDPQYILAPQHDTPVFDCECGIYAAKSIEELNRAGYTIPSFLFDRMSRATLPCVRGEVWLWGRVVEHEHGYRAQYAYPKSVEIPGCHYVFNAKIDVRDIEKAYQVPCRINVAIDERLLADAPIYLAWG